MSARHRDTIAAEAGGLDRRSLIKRAAVVGAAAWTAPVILDSLASPAAAATRTCTFVKWTISNCLFTGFTSAADCVPTAPAGCTTTASNIGPTGFCTSPIGIACDETLKTFTLTIPGGCSCVFEVGSAKTTAAGVAGCVQGVPSGDKKTLTFTTANSPTATITRVSFYISC